MHTNPSSDVIERRLTNLLPPEALEDHAEAVGVVEREGKLQIPPLVWSLAFGFATSESRTLAAFRRSYNSSADKPLSPGGYYQRLTPALAEYLRDLVEFGLDEVAVPHTVTEEFERFRDVMISDGTIVRLHEFLSDEFKARKEDKAGARLHLIHNVTDQTIDQFSITDEKAHDSTEFDTGSWLEGRLALLDLAYFKYRRFALIDENDGYFVSRLKESANPVITEELREWRGDAIPLEGKQIFDVVDNLQRKYIDVEVEVEFDRRPYAGEQSRDTKTFRVVGVRNEDADDYHLYITNLTREEFSPEDIATMYQSRWAVELLFRELKTQYELDEFNTTKPHIVEILVYAALLSLVVSRELLSLVIEHAEDDAVFPPERWAATFRSHAQLILDRLRQFLGYSPPPLLDRLIEDAQKIHQQRPILQERLATVIQPRTAEVA